MKISALYLLLLFASAINGMDPIISWREAAEFPEVDLEAMLDPEINEVVKKIFDEKNARKWTKYNQRVAQQLARGKIRSVLERTDEIFKYCTRPHYAPLLEKLLKRKLLDPNTQWVHDTDSEITGSLLTEALHCNAIENADCLLKHGANPNEVGSDSSTLCMPTFSSPLFLAIENGSLHGDCRMLEMLLHYKANPNLQHKQELLPLLTAVLDYSDPLFDALKNTILSMIKSLLRAGAEPDLVCKRPYTVYGISNKDHSALSLAQELKLPEIVELLQKLPKQLNLQSNT